MPKRVPPKKKIPTEVWVAFIGLVGVLITAILSSPLLPLLFKQQTPTLTEEPATIQPSLSGEFTPTISVSKSNEPTISKGTATRQIGCLPTVDIGVLMKCEITESGFIGLHTFDATEGEPFYVKVINGGITVLDPTGQQVIPEEYFDSSEILVTIPTSGRYTVSVSTDNGKYWLYVQNMSNLLNTQTISVGQQFIDTISTAFQHNAYTLKATAGQPVVIVMKPPKSSPLALQFIVLSQDGTKLASGISYGGVEARFTAPITGTYFMLVSDSGYDSTGQYTIVRYQ